MTLLFGNSVGRGGHKRNIVAQISCRVTQPSMCGPLENFLVLRHASTWPQVWLHLPPFTALENLPRSLRLLERHVPSTPPASLPYHPSPHSPPRKPFAALSFPKFAISRPFWSLYALIWVENGSTHSRDMPPITPPAPLTYHPSTLPLCCTVSPIIAHLKGFF